MKKRILLYYKYVALPDRAQIKAWQQSLCQSLNLQGRILIASEGINGTLCGTLENTQDYITAMNEHPLFGNIDFKESIVNGQYDYFPKTQVVVRPEIVHLGLDQSVSAPANGGTHLTPQEAHELMAKNPDDLVILDGRNYFEARVGAFKNAITPEVNNFRDFPAYIDQNLEQFADKQVLMYCTGGVRCERASAYLESKGIAKKIYQIAGGIHRYVEQFPDGFFRGKNYVFDARLTVKVNDDILSTCDICAISCDDYNNCRNAKCNKHFICCANCIEKLANACSPECLDLLNRSLVPERPYRPKVDATI